MEYEPINLEVPANWPFPISQGKRTPESYELLSRDTLKEHANNRKTEILNEFPEATF